MKPKVISLRDKNVVCFSENLGLENWLCVDGWSFKTETSGVHRLKSKGSSQNSDGSITAPMPGQILKVMVKNNQEVNEGDELFTVEAMKMEHTLKAPHAGVVKDLKFQEGESVSGADIVLIVEPLKSEG
jgi:biotin carboxyl carrier protein